MRRSRLLLRLLGAVLLLGLAACGETPIEESTATAPEPKSVTAKQVLAEIRAPGAEAVLLNVWATSCVPCVAELPDLARVANAYRDRGLRVVLVSTDFDDTRHRIPDRLTKVGITFPTFWLDDRFEALVEALPEGWSGALPVTVLFDGSGRMIRMKEGRATFEELEALVREARTLTDEEE